MARYRIVEHPGRDEPFEPQVWHWWFPLWIPVSQSGAWDCSWPTAFATKPEAVEHCCQHAAPTTCEPVIIHPVNFEDIAPEDPWRG